MPESRHDWKHDNADTAAHHRDQEITRRRLEEGDFDHNDLVIVHTDDDPDDCYHDYEEINRLNAALGTLTTVEWAEANGYQRCSECYE